MRKEFNNDPLTLYLFGNDESADLDSLLDKLEQDGADQMNQISDYFEDRLLRRSKTIPENERGDYLKESHSLFSEIKEYGNPHFVRNFFDYLFNKTRGMEDQIKRRIIFVAHSVYTSTHSVLDEKTGERQDIDSLFGIIWPGTKFSDLGFNMEYYRKLRNELNYRIKKEVMEDKRFDEQFYEQETVADLTELITDINPLA